MTSFSHGRVRQKKMHDMLLTLKEQSRDPQCARLTIIQERMHFSTLAKV